MTQADHLQNTLDRMLDDLKTTVDSDTMHKSSAKRELFPSYGSSGRSESRLSNRSGVEDGGLVKHYHKEYTSPDNKSRTITDQYEYEEGDPSTNYKRVMKSTYQNYKVKGGLSQGLDSVHKGPDPALMDAARPSLDTKVVDASQKVANKLVDALSTIDNTNHYVATSYTSNKSNKYRYDDEPDLSKHSTGGEVRKIVWRNRYDKTHEALDGTPTVSFEDESRRRQHKEHYENTSSTLHNSYSSQIFPVPTHPQQLQLQYAVYVPNTSPGSQSWTDPVPMPTPPQLSPRGEPGVAYVYSSGESKKTSSHIRNLPVVSYTTIPAEDTRSPTVQKYSYEYNDIPVESLPHDFPKPPPVYPPGPKLTYDYKKQTTKTTYDNSVETSDLTKLLHRHQPLEILESPKDRFGDPIPCGNRDVSITINKYNTKCDNEFHTRRSRSSSPERPSRRTVTHTSHTRTDSLDRLRRPHNEGMPFPETSPITQTDGNKIPTRVDDLMSTISEKHTGRFPHDGPKTPVNHEPVEEISVTDNSKRVEIAKPEVKSVNGPPVYYPPGHKQLFDESMHTMSLSEGNRKGKAKWRMEREAGMKEKHKDGGSKKGVGVVPVCLPLCCGAACVIM